MSTHTHAHAYTNAHILAYISKSKGSAEAGLPWKEKCSQIFQWRDMYAFFLR